MPTPKLHFTLADLEQWAEKGLITPEQLTGIRSYIEAAEPIEEQLAAVPEQRRDWNFVALAYYFGGAMILMAYAIFVGLKWESLGFTGQVSVLSFTIVALWAIGYFVRRTNFRVGGDLLIFVGTGIVPLLVFTLQLALGVWRDAYAHRIVVQSWMVIELVSLGVAILVIWRVRFPPISLLIAFWAWLLSMDLTRWMSQSDPWTWSDPERIASTIIGVGMLALGILLQRKAQQDYSSWFYFFGHMLILINLSVLALDREGLLGIVYFGVYLSFVIASVWLQRRIFLVFGAIGCYGYLSYLAFQVFEGALGFVFALGGMGLLIVLTAVGYQKYARPWLESQLGRYRISAMKLPG